MLSRTVQFNNCPDYLLWLQHISLFYYSFSLVSINQWDGFGAIECSAAEAATTATGECAFQNGNQVLRYFGIKPSDKTRNLIIVLSMIVLFRAACAILLTRSLKTRASPTAKAPTTPKAAVGGGVDNADDVNVAVVVQHAKSVAADA